MSYNKLTATFNNAFDKAKEVQFSPQWKNGTGYFDGAVRRDSGVQLQPGEMAKTTCPDSVRRMVFVGTRLGTIVVFERYTKGENDVFVLNNDKRLNSFLPIGATARITGDAIQALLGDEIGLVPNFGIWLENLFAAMSDPDGYMRDHRKAA